MVMRILPHTETSLFGFAVSVSLVERYMRQFGIRKDYGEPLMAIGSS
jgi:hypothetical protein